MANAKQTGNLPIATLACGDKHPGQERDHNEDCFGIFIPDNAGVLKTMGALYIVADGMGGHQAGEVASAKAREVVFQEYYQPSGGTGALNEGLDARLRRAVRKANQAVYRMSEANMQRKGMGTTTVAAVVHGSEVHIANVGDSRAYLFRDGVLKQITRDHSFVQEQIDAGILTPEQARNHPQKNVITRAMGHREDIEVDTFGGAGQLRPGDKILLCSDGLTGPVPDDQIAATLRKYPIDQAVMHLIAQANANGGPDNITAVLIEAYVPQANKPLAAQIPPIRPGAAKAAPPAGALPSGGAVAAAPPPQAQPQPQRSRTVPKELLLLGGLMLILVMIMIFAGVVLLGGGNGRAQPVEPTPVTETVTPEDPDHNDPPVDPTEALPVDGNGDNATLPPTSTPAPLTPTPTNTPPPPPPSCVKRGPTLVAPEADTAHQTGTQVTFSWRDGEMCGEGVGWQVTIQGIGGDQKCEIVAQDVDQIACQIIVSAGAYTWMVTGTDTEGRHIQVGSSPRRITITAPLPPPEQPTPPEQTPDIPPER